MSPFPVVPGNCERTWDDCSVAMAVVLHRGHDRTQNGWRHRSKAADMDGSGFEQGYSCGRLNSFCISWA